MRSFIKILCLLTALVLCLSLSACGNKEPDVIISSDSTEEIVSSEPSVSSAPTTNDTAEKRDVINPLTGLATLTKEEAGYKPLAIAINNIKVAQSIQSGVSYADVVFETVTEAGITRLLALYKAPRAEIGRIGSIRSARTVFADLAASMNAVYVHHGIDSTYCAPRINALKIPRIEISTNTDGERVQNGKSWEHTLYTSGEKLLNDVINKGFNKGNESEPWLNFTADKTASADSAKLVTVKFNGASISNFTYNEASGEYTRGAHGKELKDYFTKEEATFTNVFVLYTDISPYPDNYHTNVKLNGGEGYYVTKGGYEKISWSKSGDYSPIAFKDASGHDLAVTPGKSYICIVDKDTSNSFKAE